MIKLIVITLLSVTLQSEPSSAKEPTILFLGPNGVRPISGYGNGASSGGSSDYGSNSGMLMNTLGGVLSNIRGDRDRDDSERSSFNIFRLGERFQERQQKQKSGPRIIVIPPLGGNAKGPLQRYGSSYGGQPALYGQQRYGQQSQYGQQGQYGQQSQYGSSPYASASNSHYTRSPYYGHNSYGHRYGYMAQPSPYSMSQSMYGYNYY
ncbi:hypothetical protein HDE_00554 [Halotydeus destructor]|nr:hypothetical protein HDE_00554 [Halotydeus destructor]